MAVFFAGVAGVAGESVVLLIKISGVQIERGKNKKVVA
jgi:hypothetical protein